MSLGTYKLICSGDYFKADNGRYNSKERVCSSREYVYALACIAASYSIILEKQFHFCVHLWEKELNLFQMGLNRLLASEP